jgi:thioesterase domain-containing protein
MAGLTNHYEGSQFHGDLVYFTAAETAPASTPGAETWPSVVNGRIHDHPLPATHWRMTEHASLARIGSVLNASRRTLLEGMAATP